MKRILKTLLITVVFCIVWEMLEMIIYGEIQPRLVDDIMMILFIYIIYQSTKIVCCKNETITISPKELSDISKSNADKLGAQTSLWQTQEECGELVKAIGKYNRTKGYGQITETTEEDAMQNLIEEIADVSICIEQLAYLLRVEEQVEKARNDAFNKVQKRYSE